MDQEGAYGGEDFDENPQKINVVLVGRDPMISDFAGIEMHLKRYLKNSNINPTELAEMIVHQRHVGSVLKQAHEDDHDDSDDSFDGEDDFVYGFTTVLPINENNPSMAAMRTHLKRIVDTFGSASNKEYVHSILSKLDTDPVGLIISERFVNIPWDVGPPVYQSLLKDLSRAASRNEAMKCSHFILVARVQEFINDKLDKELVWEQAEEEKMGLIAEINILFPFVVQTEKEQEDTRASLGFVPMRNLLIISAKNFDTFVKSLLPRV